MLCPNTALCEQALAVAQSLRNADGTPLVRAAFVSSSSPPPFDAPDVAICTPAALTRMLATYGTYYGWEWTRAGLVDRIAHVVVDEADLLLTGGFARETQKLLDVRSRLPPALRTSHCWEQAHCGVWVTVFMLPGSCLHILSMPCPRLLMTQGTPKMHQRSASVVCCSAKQANDESCVAPSTSMQMFKSDDRAWEGVQVSRELGISQDTFNDLPRHLRKAAYTGERSLL